nr:CDP-glycerol glycerophosphotransferase family protein [Campylobacter insulaenigrae]
MRILKQKEKNDMFLKKKYKKNIVFLLKSLFLSLCIFFKQFKFKKYQASNKYIIVSAVYNVEKYLNDFFKSIIKQRVDFENNIFMILVDDGSTDYSINIIKKYQKKYSKNIIYLSKNHGGQASARNLGLKYIRENNLQNLWITFTDPDDLLDRDYFYEVDRFLENKYDIAMVATNIIFYREKRNILYKDTHALNFKFRTSINVCDNIKLNENIQLSVASCFLKWDYLNKDLVFDEKLILNFEDGKFINTYLLENLNFKSAFLKNAKYYYRKRFDKSSTLDKKHNNTKYFLNILERGYLEILKTASNHNTVPIFVQNVVLYELFWHTQELINNSNRSYFINKSEVQKYIFLLRKIFNFIDADIILNSKFIFFPFLYRIGFLYCFKNKDILIDRIFIEKLDEKNDEILIKFYTTRIDDKIKIFFDDRIAKIVCSKIKQHDFLDEVFVYERRVWIQFSVFARKMTCFINNREVYFVYKGKKNNFNSIVCEMKKMKKNRAKNKSLWIFADMAFRADDNAEHLYRYVMQNYPEQNIAFVLQKDSCDYKRLKKEGFNLIDPKSWKFKYLIFIADKLISSHIDRYFYEALGDYTMKTKDFVFLQHGITQNDLSFWLNQKKIDLFVVGNQAEYNSIAGDFNHYNFTPKEVKLTGFPRWDNLLRNNKINTKQILIMPTWRKYIVGTYDKKVMRRRFNPKFYESEYFYRWNSFLQSKKLQQIYEKYDYTIVFNPHPQIRPYIKGFYLPNYIIIPSPDVSMQLFFCESSFMITDYSSVAFEMSILNKPVLYYQFDREEFFTRHTMQKGYFNYNEDGFGKVVENQDMLFSEILKYLKL